MINGNQVSEISFWQTSVMRWNLLNHIRTDVLLKRRTLLIEMSDVAC